MDIAKDMLCPKCGKAFGTSLRFHKHFREYHRKNESKCTSCEKTFINEVVLRQHVIKYHETQKCSICDLELAKAALSRRILKSSLSVKPVIKFTIGVIIFKSIS